MSIITNRYLDVDSGKNGAPRRFFKSAVRWDDMYGRIRLARDSAIDVSSNGAKAGSVAEVMGSGGRGTPAGDMDEYWEDGLSTKMVMIDEPA